MVAGPATEPLPADSLGHAAGVEPAREQSQTPRYISFNAVLGILPPSILGWLPPGEQIGWSDLVNAASDAAPGLGISRHAWIEACQILGRETAATAVIVIAAKHGQNLISNPGGYLRGMIQRAAVGDLHLNQSVYGLLTADSDGRPANSADNPDNPGSNLEDELEDDDLDFDNEIENVEAPRHIVESLTPSILCWIPPGEPMHWDVLVDAASQAAPGLGVSQEAWAESCLMMGYKLTATSIIIIAAEHDRQDGPADDTGSPGDD